MLENKYINKEILTDLKKMKSNYSIMLVPFD